MKKKNSEQILQLFDDRSAPLGIEQKNAGCSYHTGHDKVWEQCGSKAVFLAFHDKEKSLKSLKFQAFWHPHSESNQELIFCSRANPETLGATGFP